MARTPNEVTTDILNNMPDEYDKSTGSVNYDLQAPVGQEISALESANEANIKNAFFDTADPPHKELIAKDRANMTRRPATQATGYVTITGDPGTAIPAGTQVSSDYLIFDVLEDSEVGEGGSVIVQVQCETAGSSGNVPAGAIYEFPVTISGLNTVTNTAAFTNGYDIESIEDFSDRYHATQTKPSGAGTPGDYEVWALEVDGVSAAVCFGRTPSVGSVTVYIMDQNHRAADATLRAAVAAHIETRRPSPANVIVSSVEEVEIDVSATVYVASGTVSDYEEAITEAIQNYILSIGYSSDARRVSVVLIGEAILGVEGVTDVDNLTVNGGTDSIALSTTEIAVLDEVTLNG